MNKYRFISDPAHGWLEVRVSELEELGIADKISAYSYIDRAGGTGNHLAYLEEDCDLAVFAKAIGYGPGDWRGFEENSIIMCYRDQLSTVRNLPHYYHQ
jgi:hypothetical protein